MTYVNLCISYHITILQLEKQENINFSDEEIYTKETPAFHSSSSNSLEAEVENDIPAMENQNGCSDGNYSAAAYQVSPFKHFQPRTLATVKVDSFELEEIVRLVLHNASLFVTVLVWNYTS